MRFQFFGITAPYNATKSRLIRQSLILFLEHLRKS